MSKRPASISPKQTVSFEVFHNGKRVARAAMPGFGVLDTIVTWVRRSAAESCARGG